MPETRAPTEAVVAALRRAAAGPRSHDWAPPSWLLPHQVEAARRVAGTITAFRGALLADAVGLGKTYVALAVASRFDSPCAIIPASLVPQWKRTAARVGVAIAVATHEALSRGARVPAADLIVVDEAHRFRNPGTRRYRALACDVVGRALLLVTATPVVNRGADLAHLLRLFLPDDGLAWLGIRSLERAAERSDGGALLHAVTPLMVARSADVALPAGSAMPVVVPRATVTAAPARPKALRPLLDALASLRFPAAGSETGARLLELHVYARLASSTAALRETLDRHAAFLERARRAVESGRAPSRSLYRLLFGPGDDLQLQLDMLLPDSGGALPRVPELEAEATRVRRAAALAEEAGRFPCPKTERLLEILGARRDRKTIVFTSAVATATDLARRLGWRQVAVVGGGRAWIASGRVVLEEALRLFAPAASGVPGPGPQRRVAALITTDLLSEGVDLQDADAVVHYDLPWTPLRLAQRIGRAARLGTDHARVEVWWFVPPPELEGRLRLLARLERKSEHQLRLTVPVSSGVGRAVRLNRQLRARELLVPSAPGSDAGPGTRRRTLTAVVRGPAFAVCAFRWRLSGAVVPELVAMEGMPWHVIDDLERVSAVLERLSGAPPSSQGLPGPLREALLGVIRTRLRSLDAGPDDSETRRLRRLLLRRAREAGQNRNAAMLGGLDLALDRLAAGLSVGGTAELAAVLGQRPTPPALRDWAARHAMGRRRSATVAVEAVLSGDGSRVS